MSDWNQTVEAMAEAMRKGPLNDFSYAARLGIATTALTALRETHHLIPKDQEPVGWQPIETAPKDETACLIANDRGQFVAWFDKGWGSEGWWMVGDGKDFERPLRGDEPTVWQPLPLYSLPEKPNGL